MLLYLRFLSCWLKILWLNAEICLNLLLCCLALTGIKESDTGLAPPALWDLAADKQTLQSEQPLQVARWIKLDWSLHQSMSGLKVYKNQPEQLWISNSIVAKTRAIVLVVDVFLLCITTRQTPKCSEGFIHNSPLVLTLYLSINASV